MDAHLRGIFAAEAETLLTRMAREALALEDGDAGAGHIDQLFRDAHTLKGSAALMGLQPCADVAHALEDVLGDLRSGRRRAQPDVVDVVLRGVDDLRGVVAGALAGHDVEAAVAAAVARLRGEPAAADDSPPPEPGPPPREAAEPSPPEPDPPPREAMEPEPPAPAAAASPGAPAAEDTVRVSRARLDRMVALAGQAVTAELRLRHVLGDAVAADPDAEATAARLARTLRALQDQTLRARMTTLAAIAEPLQRAARDVARAAGKELRLELDAEAVELDRAVLDALRDPLLHLVRNAAGHGIEPPAEREAAGKPAAGTLAVRARRVGGEVVVEVADDGRGLDLDALRERTGQPDLDDAAAARLAFAPGMSTAAAVTGLSGRGVGLDVVGEAVRALRGDVQVTTDRGRGTTFTLRVPMSLAVLPCLVVRVGAERYALPAHATETAVEAAADARVALEGGAALWVGGDVVPVTALAALLGRDADRADGPAVVLRGADGRRHAVRVDELLHQRPVTVAELGGVLPPLDVVAGASIEPDGSVILVLDPAALVARAGGAERPRAAGVEEAAPSRAATVLVVDDALTVRELQRAILERSGFEVRTAADGQEALERLDEARPDLVVTDLEMPRLDGFGLLASIRARAELQGLPVLVVSSRADESDRTRALRAGADSYIVKRDFDEHALLQAVRELLGGA